MNKLINQQIVNTQNNISFKDRFFQMKKKNDLDQIKEYSLSGKNIHSRNIINNKISKTNPNFEHISFKNNNLHILEYTINNTFVNSLKNVGNNSNYNLKNKNGSFNLHIRNIKSIIK